MACVFCKSGDENVSICSNCLQKLLLVDVKEVQRLYKIALEKYPEKARALLDFAGSSILEKRMIRQRKFEHPQMIRRAKCRAV